MSYVMCRESARRSGRWLAVLGLLSVLMVSVLANSARAQSQPANPDASPSAPANQAPDSVAAQQFSQQLFQGLQTIRPLTAPPAVSDVVTAKRADGGSAMVPVTAASAIMDLRIYHGDVMTLFPVGQTYYPTDSLRDVQRVRAADWVHRFETLPKDQQLYAVNGWERIPLAEIAAQAANDSASRRLFDARIAELANAPRERSFALFDIVATLADPTQDSARLVRNLAIAETYLKALRAIPSGGYKLRHDSVAVLYNQWWAEDTLALAYGIVGDTAKLFVHARRLLPYGVILGVRERGLPLGRAYERVLHALDQTPAGRARIVAFEPEVLAAVRRAMTELPADVTADERRDIQSMEPSFRHYMAELAAWYALLGTPAPSLSAHLWPNTADSVYADVPRTVSLADGKVHVLFFGDFRYSDQLSIMNRAQQRFPSGVQVLYIINTHGSAGPDLTGPRAETDWLTRYLVGLRHMEMPFSIWAGKKVPSGFVPEGHYVVMRPEPTPNEKPYHANMFSNFTCAMIDKHGMIRFYQDFKTRKDETVLWKRIQLLLNESTSTTPSKTSAPAPTHASAETTSQTHMALTLPSTGSDHGTH